MNSRTESHEALVELERAEDLRNKWAAGLIPVPASLVGRGGIYDTTWITTQDARRLSEGLRVLWAAGGDD